MNERIKELMVELKKTVSTHRGDEVLIGYNEIEKFAELIVRECIAQASISNGHGNNQWDKALTFAAKNIKEHFGVEE